MKDTRGRWLAFNLIRLAGYVVITAFFLCFLPLAWGYVFSTYWDWFVAPHVGVIKPAYWHFVTVMVLILCIKAPFNSFDMAKKVREPYQEKEKYDMSAMWTTLFVPVASMAMGWLWHWIIFGLAGAGPYAP